MKCNLNALNTYPNWIHSKHFKWDELEIWWIFGNLRKRFAKILSKIRKLSKNCSVKIGLLFIAKDLQYKIHLLSLSYDSNTRELYKKSLRAVVTKNIERFFILFLRIIHTDFRSSHLEPSTLKRLHWSVFL